jgi:hypothetical protein
MSGSQSTEATKIRRSLTKIRRSLLLDDQAFLVVDGYFLIQYPPNLRTVYSDQFDGYGLKQNHNYNTNWHGVRGRKFCNIYYFSSILLEGNLFGTFLICYTVPHKQEITLSY